jgi:hypothetical protein
MLFFSLVSMSAHKLDQKLPTNQESQSEIMDLGNPKCTQTF